MEGRTLTSALERFQNNTGLKAKWKLGPRQRNGVQYDATLRIMRENAKPLEFLVEIKQDLRQSQVVQLLDQKGNTDKFIVIAAKTYPRVREQLQKLGINYIDTAGYAYIKEADFFIWLGMTQDILRIGSPPNHEMAFTKTGAQVIFVLLADEDHLNLTYREIADLADVSLGKVSNVVNALIEKGFMVRKTKDEKKLVRKSELFDRWVEVYTQKLKPSLQIGTYTWNKSEYPRWQDFPLKTDDKNQWGGAVAAEILTDYLIPNEYELYTSDVVTEVKLKLMLAPDENGKLRIYRKFWKNAGNTTAPPMIVYADLINNGSPRYLETAKRIYDDYIKDRL